MASALRIPSRRPKPGSILLSAREYRRLLERIELLEDSLALRRARNRPGRLLPHADLVARLRRKGRL